MAGEPWMPREGHGAGGRVQAEAGVRFAGLGLGRFAVGPDHQEPPGLIDRARGEPPFRQVRVVIGQVVGGEIHRRSVPALYSSIQGSRSPAPSVAPLTLSGWTSLSQTGGNGRERLGQGVEAARAWRG